MSIARGVDPMYGVLQVLSIPLAAAASWLVGAIWYSSLSETWLAALGKTREQILGPSGKPSPLPFAISFVALLVMATVLAALMHTFGRNDLAGGLGIGILAWLGFVATTMGTNYAFAGAPPNLILVDGGHWLLVLLVQGAVIGALS